MLGAMRPRLSLTPVLIAILSCGDPGLPATTDSVASTGGAATTTGTTEQPTTEGSTTSATSDAGTSSTTAPGTTEPGTTGATETGTTTMPDPSTSGASETTDGSSTGGQSGVAYAAFFVPGGLDRIVVRKADFDADLCTSVLFVSPMPNIQPDLFIPDMWSFQNGEIAQGTADCLVFMGSLVGAVAAADISGSADWPAPGPCPGPLDIDASLVFAPGPPWVPAQDPLAATDLPLQGC